MSLNNNPKASFPLVTVVVTIAFSKPALDAGAGAEVERVAASKELFCGAREAIPGVRFEDKVP
jgi:hypothetical protein